MHCAGARGDWRKALSSKLRAPQGELSQESSVTESDSPCAMHSDKVLVILASLNDSPLSVPFVRLPRCSILVLYED